MNIKRKEKKFKSTDGDYILPVYKYNHFAEEKKNILFLVLYSKDKSPEYFVKVNEE